MTLDASAESISEFLGQPVLSAIVVARDNAAVELADWRRTSPSEIAAATPRGLANRIHDRFIHHMVNALDTVDGVAFKERRSARQFVVKEKVVLVCKRHDQQDKIKAYPTRTAIDLWGDAATLDGLSTINVAAGYRWDKELREIGVPVLSFRKALRARPVWVVNLSREEGAAAPVRIIPPAVPGLPSIDLFGLGDEREDGTRQ